MERNQTKENNDDRKLITKDDVDLPLLRGLIQDFATAARLVEQEITRHRPVNERLQILASLDGRSPGNRHLSMMAVAHFNLGTALELLLKYLIVMNGGSFFPKNHNLTELHKLLPDTVQGQLELTFQDTFEDLPFGCEIRAFSFQDPPVPPSNLDRDLTTLVGFFGCLHDDMKLYLKRYSYELVKKELWYYEFHDLSLFLKFIDHVMENIEQYIAPEVHGKHGE